MYDFNKRSLRLLLKVIRITKKTLYIQNYTNFFDRVNKYNLKD